MNKRLAATVPALVVGYALIASVVYPGISLSSRLMGRWKVVKVFGSTMPAAFPPMTIELDKSGKLVGRSRCGTFTGRWSTGNNEVRFQGLVPSSCTCGDLRQAEQRFLEAIGSARQTRIGKDGLILMNGRKAVAVLVPQRT